ncbi:MAG: DUF255 domain-containing protein, partial [Planctomycetota bacterium]
MTDKPNQPSGNDVSTSGGRKPHRGLWLILAAFLAFVIIVFVTHREKTINWVEDYQAGLQLARRQNKPVLLAFYKQFTRYTTPTFEDTYTSPKVIEFVETNFVPILINVDEQPEIAELYKVGYYPSHFIKRPDSNDVLGPLVGYDPPDRFI